MTSPMGSGAARSDPPSAPIQGAAHDETIVLYGSRILDLVPRGDLGPGLRASMETGFALVRGYSRRGHFASLPEPVVLAVVGEGREARAGEPASEAGERLWEVRAGDPGLKLDLHNGSVAALLMI